MAIDRAKLDQRFKALKGEASSWVPMWQDLSRYIRPTRGFFDGQNPNDGSKMDHKTIVDGTALRAARTLAAGMTSGLTRQP